MIRAEFEKKEAYIGVEEAAQRLGYTKGAVCLLCREGKLRDVYKEGREWRISERELEQYKPLPKGFVGAAVARRYRNAGSALKCFTDVDIAKAIRKFCFLIAQARKVLQSREANLDERLLAFYGTIHIFDELDTLVKRFSSSVKRKYPALKRTSFQALKNTILASYSNELVPNSERLLQTMQALFSEKEQDTKKIRKIRNPIVKRLCLLERVAEILIIAGRS